MSEIHVSVVIPTFNRLADLKNAVESVAAQSYPVAHIEVLIVDNGSTDGTGAWAAEYDLSNPLRIRHIPKNPEGPGAARNRGAEEAAGRYVLLMDSDVTLGVDWIRHAVEFMEAHTDAGMVGGRVVYGHDTAHLNAYGGCLSPIGLAWDFGEGAPVGVASEPVERLWINCSAVMARRDVLLQAPFDNVYFYGYEDSDVGWRAALAGHHVWVLPTLTTYHHVGTAVGASDATIVFHYSKNRLRSILKNWGAARAALYVPAYVAYAIVDAVVRTPRAAKLKALYWNLQMLPDTLVHRRNVQSTRRVSDRELMRLFDKAWFPPTRLAGRRRRPALDSFTVQPDAGLLQRDDRVR